METDDLIEISAEDDSLLCLEQEVPSPQVFSSSKKSIAAAFSCSPLLQIPRSSRSLARPPLPLPPIRSALECAKEVGDADEISPSSAKGGIDKENAQMNISEAPKLGVERQQMKRKKKGGGYNLRKSLAWDRAFFTEEGVLDPSELSMLSGNVGSCGGERLSMIHEEVEPVSKRLESVSESTNSHSIRDTSIKKSPASTLKSRNVEGVSSLKGRASTRGQASALSSPVKPKAISARDANRSPSIRDANKSASKYSGCPRPVASSSLKRPLQPNISRVANREPKVSKVSAPKENLPLSSASSRSSASSARDSKHSHIPQPAVQPSKTIRPKGSCGSAKILRNEIKPSHSGKPTARSTRQPASRNVVKSVPEKHSSDNRELPKASKPDDDSLVLHNHAVAHPVSSSDESAVKHAASVSQNDNYNVKDTQTVQSQPAKPSGLRMPSPSLRYFEQSKAVGSQGSLQRSCKPGNLPLSGTPTHQKPPLPPRDRAVQASSVYAASPVQSKSNSNRNDRLNKEDDKSNSFNSADCQQSLHNMNDTANLQSQDCLGSEGIAEISHTEDIGSGRNNNSLLVQENSNIIRKATETEGLAANTNMISNQDVESVGGSVSGRPVTACLSYGYVEDAVTNDGSSNVPKDQLSSFLDSNKKCKENELSLFTDNVEGGEYSVSMRDHFMEDAVSNGGGQLHQDSIVESQRSWVNYAKVEDATLTEVHRSTSDDDASPKIEANPAGYDVLHSLNAGTKDDPNGIDSSVMESRVGDTGMQPLEASRCDGTIINCEADMEIGKAEPAPVQLHPTDGSLSLESKVEVCVAGTCDSDVFSHGENLSQIQVDIALLTSPDLQPENASGYSNIRKDGIVCTEAFRPTLLQVKKTSDLRADLDNQTTNVFATGESRRENDQCGQFPYEFIKLDSEFACDQDMIEETIEGDAGVQESDGRTSDDINNMINCETHEASQVNNTCGQSQAEAVAPENEFSGDQRPIEELAMEDAEVQDCDGSSFVNISGVINCQTPGRYEENNKCDRSQSDAMKPESESAGDKLLIEETIMEEDAEVQDCDDSSFVDISNVTDSEAHKESEEQLIDQPKSDHFIGEVPSDNFVSFLSPSLLPPGICSAEDRDASGDTTDDPLNFGDLTSDEVRYPECLSAEEKAQSSSDSQQSSESNILGRINDDCCMHGDQVNKQVTVSVSPLRSSAHEIEETATTSDSTAVNENSTSQVYPSDSLGYESMVLDMDVESSEEDVSLPEEDKRLDTIDRALQHEMESETLTCSIETVDEKKEADAPAAIKLPLDAAPFSEEWLAAIEAAGEEILTKKSGAVQHSPPEKVQPEPGPWSPVKKRKNQEIGPFDCTKYTNMSEPSTT